MPKPKKDKEKKTSGAGGWDWSSFATEPPTPAKTTSQPQQPQNKGAGWDWSTLPTNQADETRRQEQRQAGQQAAARYAAQDRVISAGRYAADAMRGGLRTLGMGRDYTADDLEIQSDRYRRDYQRYTEMARDARQYRDADLLSMAQNGLRQSGDAYNDSYQRYMEAQQQAKDKRNQELKETNKAQWYGATLSREQIEGQLRLLERERETMQGMTDKAYRAYADGSSRGSDLQYEGYSKRLQNIDDEIATYKAALGQRQAIEYQDTRDSIAPHGYLPEAMWGQRDEGRRKYEADRAASVHAVGDMAGDELSSGRTGYADYRRAMTESGYNYEFEEAKHLKQVDADIFYVLYNEDPEKAREWLHQAKLSREEQYASQLSEWAGRDAGTTAMAFVGGTAARIGSGLLNLLTGTTEDALNASRTGKALLAGGAERLNRVYGTVDERIPFIGNLLGGKGLGDLYQLASSVVESHLTAGIAAGTGELSDAVQALGVIIMGSSAAADDYDECLKRGLNEDQARRHAFAAGLNEAAFEWISLDKLVNPNFSASQIRQWLVQSGVEASEEFCTTIANRLTDGLLARRDGYDTQIEQRMKELIALGVDYDEAKERAEHEWTTELINDALGGFLSGGAGQMLNSVTGYAMSKYGDVADRMRFENDQSRRLERSGAAITSQEELQSLQSYAKANGIQFDQAAEAKLASTGATDSSTPAEASAQNDSGRQGAVPTEQELSRKKKRQQAKSNRSTGVLQEQVVRSISDSIQKRGLDQAQTVYDETVSKHGQGIARQAAEAVRRSASEQLGKLNNSAELEQAYKAASAGATEPAVRKAIDQAYNAQAYAIAQRTGNEEAAERVQQRVLNTSASGNRNLSLEVQVTNKDGSTSTAEITGVTANAEQVKLSNGQTVAVDQLAGIDADTKDVLDRIKHMEVGPAANLMWKAYQLEKKSGTVTDGYRWIMDYTLAFDQGRQGSISLEQAIGRAEGLSPQIAEMAYQQGRDLAQEMTDQQKADLTKRTSITRKGATGRAGTVNTDAISDMRLSEAQKKQLDIVKRIAEVFGIDVEVFASGTKNVTVNGKRMRAFQGENGSYENGRIRLDINAGLNYIGDIGSGLVATIGHELTHFIQQFAPQEYKAYKEFVLATIAKTRGSQTLERLIQEKIDRSKSKLSRTAAEDEVVADAAQTVLTDSQAIRQMAEQEPTLFEKVLQWIKDFFDEIRDALADSPRMSEEARLFRGLEADVKKAFGELWDKGLREAVRVHDEVGDIESSKEQNSDRATDEAYMEAVKNGWDGTVDSMVREAAEEAGYTTPKLYHGTRGFGFTRFDLTMGESMIFATASQELAKTYSGETERTKIYQRSDIDANKLRGEELLREANKNGKFSGYSFMTKAMREEAAKDARNSITVAMEKTAEFMNNHEAMLDTDSMKWLDKALNAMSDLTAAKTEADVKLAWMNYDDAVWALRAHNLEAKNAFVDAIDTETLFYDMNDLKRLLDDGDLYINKKSPLRYVLGRQIALELNAELRKGVYELYGRPGRQLVIDAQGSNWNQIRPPAELDLYGPQRTRDIADAALKRGYDSVLIQNLRDSGGETGYNGPEDIYIFYDADQVKSADPVTYDDSGNVIPLSERFNRENEDIRFSMRSPVETTDRLIALHNLNAVKLGKALDLGGFPMPSIAVTKTSIPHTNFGPITLVMDKSTIDPMQDRRNTVYSADAWTPTFPSVEYEVNEKVASRLRKKYFEIVEKYGKDAAGPLYPWANYAEDELNRKGGPEEILDRYRKDPDMMKLYLVDNGLNVPATVTEEAVERMDESTVKFYDTFVQEMGKDVFEELMVRKGETAQDVKKRWYAEHGDDFEAAYRKYMQGMGFSEEEIGNVLNNETISSLTRQAINIRNYLRTGAEKKTVTTNVTATNNAIRAAVDSEKYDAWLRDLFDGIVKSQGIYNGKDRFTPSGNERSFAATHYSVTLENIAKAMAAQNDGNSRNVSGFYGVKSLRAGTAKRFSSIAEMHKYEGRLQHLTEEQAEKINEALSDRLGNVMGQIYDSKPHGKYDNSFIGMDAIGENLMEITEQKNITNASIQRVFSKYGYQISDTLAGEVRALLFDISQMPVNIYEAKPERAVRFDEVLAAIVPTDTDKALLEKLRDAGVQNLIEYAAGDDTDRLAKVNSVEGAQFSERDYSLPSDHELMDNAAESLSEAGGEEYWNALLESAPELAGDREELRELMKANRAAARKLAETEAKLEEARRQMKPGGNRKLNTRGIATVTQNVMKDLHAGDAKNRGVEKGVTQILTNAYQKGLDAIDAGKDPGDVWDIVFNEGVMKATDYLLQNATYAEKHGRGWITTSLGAYMPGEDGRFAIMDAVSARVVMDWGENRVREAMQTTIADRLIERTENRMQKQIDAATERATTAEQTNKKLTEDLDFWRTAQDNAAQQVTFLDQQLKETRQKMKANNRMSAKERKASAAKAEALANRLTAKRREAAAWKRLAEQNERLLRAALQSKNADLAAQSRRAETAETALAGEKVNAKAWERNADLYAKQLDKTLEQKARIVKQLEAQVEREKKILAGTLTPPAMQRLLKAAREDARKKAETHKDEVFQNYKERKNQTAIRNRIKNLHAEMQRDLLKPREGHFVPEALIRPVVELLDMMNTQTNRAKSENAQAKIDAINAQYDKLKNDERYSQYYDETVKALLVELSSTLNGRSIYQLNSDELADVYTAMKAMRTTIRNAIKADLVEKGKEIFEIGDALRQELRNGKGASPYLLEKYHMSMLNAQRAFHRFGGYRQDSTWDKVYRMLDNAQLKMLNLEMQATRIFDPVLKAEEDFERAQDLTSIKEKDLVDVGLKDENGNAVKITRGMMLGLWMHLQNEENMRHIMYGGMTLPDFKRYYDGNPEAWGRGTVEIPALGARVSNLDQLLDEQGEQYVDDLYKEYEDEIREMFESVRTAIEEKLTAYDRKWIAASKDFFDNFSRRELNRVTNSMYGFSKAKVDNYFPIVTDSNFLKSEFDTISRNVSLENAGFMKERVKASNPILLEDITRTVNRQISNVSRYAGLTEALKQFGNIYNVHTKGFTDSVKKAMAKSYGKTGQEYIQNLITDMVGGRSTPGTIFDRIKGNYAQAVLSANLSVTIKQAASYPTAAAVIGWKPLAKALAKGGRKGRVFSRADRALIDTYSPLLWKRSQGAIDTEIGDMAHAQDWTKKAKWLMGWIEKTDIATVGRLWYAAEYYVQDNFKGLEKGTAEQIRNGESEYYRKVAEIFNRIVEETQPNYTVLQRPDILRNPNKLLRSLVMFSTQRFQNGQILMDAAAEYGAMRSLDRKGSTEETIAARQEAKRKLTWAITSQAVSAVVLNAMTLLAGALMHRMNPWRDDDDEITLESTAGALLDGWVESLAGSFLGGSEIYEALDSLLTGSTYYGNDVGGLSSINDFASALITMGQKAVKLVGDENSKPEDWTNLAKNQLWKVGEYLSQMTGVPVANIKKILEGGKAHVVDAINGNFGSFEASSDLFSLSPYPGRSGSVNARRYLKAFTAGDGAKMQAVLTEMQASGKSEDSVKSALSGAAKDAYNSSQLGLDRYAEFLISTGYWDEEKAGDRVVDFLKDEYEKGLRTEEDVTENLIRYKANVEDENDAWKVIQRWETTQEHKGEEDYNYSEYEDLNDDLNAGKSFAEAAAEYLEHGYKEENLRKNAVDNAKKRYQAGDLTEDEAIDLLLDYAWKKENGQYRNLTKDEAWMKVKEWRESADYTEEDGSWGQYDAIDEALAGNKDIKALVSELTAHGVEEKNITQHVKGYLVDRYVAGQTNETQLKNQLSRYLSIVARDDVAKILNDANSRKQYGVSYSSLDEEYRAGKIGKNDLKQAMMKYGGLSSADADKKIRWYDLQKQNPNLEISESRATTWYDGTTYTKTNGRESAKTAGMSISDYLRAKDELAKVQGVDANNDGRTDTGSREIAYIRALTAMSWLTDRQRRALYYEEYKGTSKTSNRPW